MRDDQFHTFRAMFMDLQDEIKKARIEIRDEISELRTEIDVLRGEVRKVIESEQQKAPPEAGAMPDQAGQQ